MTRVPTHLQLPGSEALPIDALPAVIRVPAVSAGGGDPVTDKPLADATLADLNAHLVLSEAEITADAQRLWALTALLQQALATGATPDSPVLAAADTLHPHHGD
jgi:hypothetical protein